MAKCNHLVSLHVKGLKVPIHPTFFRRAILIRKVGQSRETNRVLACDQGSLVGLCRQDYKSLCAAVTICFT